MQKRTILTLLIIAGLNTASFGQQPKYTPKHFVVYKDTTKFKPTKPPMNGFSKVYLELQRPEIWDTDDNNTTQVTGYTPALVCIEGNFKNGKKNDIFKAYLIDSFDHSKRYKIWEQTYLEDKLNGEWRTYFLNGTLAKVATYKDDTLHGIYRKFWIDGKTIEEEREYLNGSNTYVERTYFKSGKPERETPYKNGKINGIVRAYYENGQLKSVTPAVNDQEHGLVKRYYEDGTLMEELSTVNGKFHGIRKYYHPNGKLWSVEEYKNGMPWNAIANYTDKGMKRPQGTLKNGTGTLIFYDDNGAVSETLKFTNGQQQ
jgi:antitoxin component YwqK of YwqJK toxin-antitoxin module